MADLLGRIERILEDAVEGTSRRLFRARLQPVELAKAASRAMQEQQVIGPDGPEVPNHYRIRLHPSDYAHFAPYQHALEAKLGEYLERFAADRRLRPVADWRVQVAPDDAVRPRAIRVDARMEDVGWGDVDDASGAPGRVDATAVGPAETPAPPATGERATTASLVTEDGRQLALTRDVTTLGRGLDNDVVVDDTRVSRYHAEIRRSGPGYVIRDLGSTNGTAVAGRRVTERALGDGDEISLGGFTIVLRTGGL